MLAYPDAVSMQPCSAPDESTVSDATFAAQAHRLQQGEVDEGRQVPLCHYVAVRSSGVAGCALQVVQQTARRTLRTCKCTWQLSWLTADWL